MSTTEELLENNRRYAGSFDKGDLPMPPSRRVAIYAAVMRMPF